MESDFIELLVYLDSNVEKWNIIFLVDVILPYLISREFDQFSKKSKSPNKEYLFHDVYRNYSEGCYVGFFAILCWIIGRVW